MATWDPYFGIRVGLVYLCLLRVSLENVWDVFRVVLASARYSEEQAQNKKQSQKSIREKQQEPATRKKGIAKMAPGDMDNRP